MGLGAEIYPEVPRKWSKIVPEGKGPVSDYEVEPAQPTMVDLYQMIKQQFEESGAN